MPDDARSRLVATISAARARVATFYGGASREPIVLACTSETCDRRLGGLGARATTYSTVGLSVVRLSPRGLDPVIITHELAHVALHGRIGMWKLMRGVVAAWFDEGLAVIISDDARYLQAGESASARCRVGSAGALPSSPFAWAPEAGRNPSLYAAAACRVLEWIESNGGRPGLLAAIEALSRGDRTLP